MAVKIRLRRMGRKKHPVYALVATDARSPRDGRFIEDLGRYEPIQEPATVKINEDRILYWLQQGAQPSDTVRNLLSRQGVMLQLHLRRKGKTEDEIAAAVAEFREGREAKEVAPKTTAAERRAAALEAERKQAAEDAKKIAEERAAREAELAKQKAEAEAEARKKAEEARAEAAAAEEAAQGEAQEEAAETAAEAEPVAEAEAEVPEEAPDAAEEQPAAETETTEEVADATGEEVAAQADAGAEDGNDDATEEKA